MVKQRGKTAPLLRKQLRDLKGGWKSFLAILVICASAVMLYVGIDATWRCIEIDLDRQFERSNMADLWVRGELSDRTARDIEAIAGVLTAQRRASAQFEAKELLDEPDVTLVTNDGDPAVCVPLLREGSPPSGKNECMLGQRFARAHGLNPGDTLRLSQGDRVLELKIAGLGAMPEFVVASDGDELAPSPLKKGYAYVPRDTLSFLPFSEIALTIAEQADLGVVKASIRSLLADRQTVVIERDDVFGIKMAMEQAQQIHAMGVIFPLVFFVIAALITWTTMNRLVESQRLQIGSLFAMGYGRRDLTWHYAGYGLLIAVLGSLVGFAGARYAIAPILMSFINSTYALPDAVPYMSPLVLLAVALVLMAVTGGASILSARAALSQAPASLLRPKPPGRGKRIFLENMRALWRRVPFSEKMILRNMFRNPVRFLMGLIGALGCSALMLAGFGLRDSVDYVLVNHYTRTMHYDARVNLEDDAPVNYAQSVALRAGAAECEAQMIESAEIFVEGTWRVKHIYVLSDGHDMIRLSDGSGARVTLPPEGAALTRKAAEDYGLTLSDELRLRMPGGRAVAVRIARIVDLQLDQGVYMTRSAWEKLNLKPFTPTAALLRGDGLNLDAAKDMDGVIKARTLSEERDTGQATLAIMNVVVLLLVVFSGVLELLVFYNLGQLNFSERIRELATLKVLGFTPREIKKLVLRENIVITMMGLPLGLVLGPFLLEVLLTYGLPNTIQFVPHLSVPSWLYTTCITIAFALMVNWMLGSKFRRIDMVEALKSVE
ncbi:MAG: ABC transporter permease [Eubacteriales bacterium]|nr:ABC transporter permease [Christensenellaceae bacterium]MEA5067318.1 ABC transporter permease [Eubacteriales bacterium]